MSDFKHTPGPRHVGVATHGDCRIYSGSESHAIARTYGPELNGIGVCDLTGPMNRADARLIAAAPDLLESLQELANAAFARDTVMGDPCALLAAQANLRDAAKRAQYAIAKAIGSEP